MVYKLFANLDTKQEGQQYDNSPFTKLWLTGSFYEFSNIYGNILVDPTGIQKAEALLKPLDMLSSHHGNLYHLTKAEFLLFNFIME